MISNSLTKSRLWFLLLLVITCSFGTKATGEDPVFSGPQVGEKLLPLEVLSVYGDTAGTNVDPVKLSDGQPMLMIFVHHLTRPGLALTRALTEYSLSQEEHGAYTHIVWLDDDKAKAEAYLTRASSSLRFAAPVGISVDGGEGPGAYGLNRNVELTILVAKDNVVQANYALVQPSVTEAAKIAANLAKLIDQSSPTQEQLEKIAYPREMMQASAMQRQRPTKPAASDNVNSNNLREMMKQFIARDIDEESARKSIEKIENWIGDNPKRKSQAATMIRAVIQRGMGSESAQPQLEKWLKDFGEDQATETHATETIEKKTR